MKEKAHNILLVSEDFVASLDVVLQEHLQTATVQNELIDSMLTEPHAPLKKNQESRLSPSRSLPRANAVRWCCEHCVWEQRWPPPVCWNHQGLRRIWSYHYARSIISASSWNCSIALCFISRSELSTQSVSTESCRNSKTTCKRSGKLICGRISSIVLYGLGHGASRQGRAELTASLLCFECLNKAKYN